MLVPIRTSKKVLVRKLCIEYEQYNVQQVK